MGLGMIEDNEANSTVGDWLASARVAKGVTLKQASEVTRIGKSYLNALEENKFDEMPNEAYAKGFVRQYASFLGLSGDEAVVRLEKQLNCDIQEIITSPEGVLHKDQHRDKRFLWGKWVIPSLLLSVILLVSFFQGGSDEKPRVKAVHEAVKPVSPPLVQTKYSSVPSGSSLSHHVSADQPAQKASATDEKGVVLKLKVVQDTSLHIVLDGTVSQQYDLKAGDVIEWKGEKSFLVDLGNGDAVEAELNGNQLKKLGEQGKPVHLIIRSDGLHKE